MSTSSTIATSGVTTSTRCDVASRWHRRSLFRRTVGVRRTVATSYGETVGDVDVASGPQLKTVDVLAARRRATLRAVTNEEEIALLLDAAPARVRDALGADDRRLELSEIVLDVGRLPTARFPDGDTTIGDEMVTYDDLARLMDKVGDFGRDNRAGINGTLHRVSAIRNRYGKVVGATCRVGRSISGSAALIRDILEAETSVSAMNASILLLGRPGVGKTTAIREISRILAEEHHRRVVIVDTSNEIAGDGDVPHKGIGSARRMQVPTASEQHLVLIEAVENHTPETIVVDEVGTEAEANACRTIAERGVQLIGTAHGHTLENVLKNPSLCDLIGGVVSVTLGDDEARRRGVQKSVLEREGPPTFTIAVEMLDVGTWRVHTDVAASVDALLAGQSPMTELRTLNADGSVTAEADSEWAAMELTSSSLSSLSSNKIGSAQDQDRRSEDVRDVGETDDDEEVGCSPNALRVFPFKVSREALERVMSSMGLSERVCLVDLLEDASVVVAPKSQVKTSTWLRHAARARGMPIYAVRADNSAQLVRALQAMLGITGAGDGIGNASQEAQQTGIRASSTADETDALEEVRMAVEQLVIPHREPVELLPRSNRIIAMQQALVDTYSLSHSAIGEGNERRLRIEYEYNKLQ
ncbi:hypothetical protein BE221DRAFT_102832 [Ostreococcus tauri]|uniref:AAA+ ATPase domain-containing protein n=1 Tax=Ostreococcus tauri TaxID=70448 RepID=A0A1Y5HYG5_OSTTA|nr:hypothetical protein BE221DRAFT_102832 [Ostreococcus tauri]